MSNKIKIISSWNNKDLIDFFGNLLNVNFDVPIEFYIDCIPTNEYKNIKKIIFLLEPPEIASLLYGNINEQVVSSNHLFDYILTHNQDIINSLPEKSILFPYGTTWIKDYEFKKKKYSVSTLVGAKLMSKGHYLRHILWFRQNRITNIPTRFYISGNNNNGLNNYNNNPVLGNDKKPLFNSQFHICIENTKRDNWFTEKLIDCLITKTIPIYWGCPNIKKWFNLDGFIIVDTLDDIVKACNSLTEKTYQEKLKAVEENYEISKKYANIGDRFVSTINELINK